jgi:hypothetical protein
MKFIKVFLLELLGLSVDKVSGLAPIVALEHVFANKEILLVITPTIIYQSKKMLHFFWH